MPVSIQTPVVSLTARPEVQFYGTSTSPRSTSANVVSGTAVQISTPVVILRAGSTATPTFPSLLQAYLEQSNCPRVVRYPLIGWRGHFAYES